MEVENKLGAAAGFGVLPKFENSELPRLPVAAVEAVVAGVGVAVEAPPPKREAPKRGAGLGVVSVDNGRVDDRFNGDDPNRPPPDGAAEEFPKSDMSGL